MKAKYEKPAIESKESFERISASLCLTTRTSSRPTCQKVSGTNCPAAKLS